MYSRKVILIFRILANFWEEVGSFRIYTEKKLKCRWSIIMLLSILDSNLKQSLMQFVIKFDKLFKIRISKIWLYKCSKIYRYIILQQNCLIILKITFISLFSFTFPLKLHFNIFFILLNLNIASLNLLSLPPLINPKLVFQEVFQKLVFEF